MWQGRRLAWWIAVGFGEFKQNLTTCTSERLQTLLAEVDSSARGEATSRLELMRTRLVEYYVAKYEYLFHGVRYSIGAFYVTEGGSPEQSREILAKVLDEVDSLVAQNKSEQLDRVTQKLYLPGGSLRRHAELYIHNTDLQLREVPILYIKLQEYALIPAVGRRIEAAHAHIKRVGQNAFGIQLPQLCAMMRETQNLQALRDDFSFKQFCIDSWHSKRLLGDILIMRMGADELKGMSRKAQHDLVYQCSLGLEYENKAAEKQSQVKFSAEATAICAKPQKPAMKPNCVWITSKGHSGQVKSSQCHLSFSGPPMWMCLCLRRVEIRTV